MRLITVFWGSALRTDSVIAGVVVRAGLVALLSCVSALVLCACCAPVTLALILGTGLGL